MAERHHVAVIDIGKTNAKLALVDLGTLTEIEVRKRSNAVLAGPPYPHYDTDGLWEFILGSLTEMNRSHGIDAITVTTHGAAAALLDGQGELAAPVLDYEHDGPDTLAASYDAIRPDFAETGSPRLPMGLNLGAQLFWQFKTFPDIRKRTRAIVTYPQYWTFRLTGKAVNEVTSLGCHTDLWCPRENRFSSLVERAGWAELMVPVAKAADCLGPLLQDVAEATGLNRNTPVYCGIHDSNASIYTHMVSREAPFAVVSTGTWVISMAVGGNAVELDPARDTLINVNAFGDPVPSARFMGGREFDRMMEGVSHDHDARDVAAVMERGIMLLPSVETGSGPFQGQEHRWTVRQASLTGGQRFVAVSCYLALMTATGLEMIGAQGPVLVEGPFADNSVFLDMLGTATRKPVSAVAGTGTSVGAALLTASNPLKKQRDDCFRTGNAGMASYARIWRASV
jgi:sugar (pentulose or hexulose) kinase